MTLNCLGPEDKDSDGRNWYITKIVLGLDNVKQLFLSAGSKTSAESISVVPASDYDLPSIIDPETDASETPVSVNNAAATVLMAANSDRKGGWLQNLSDATLWLSLTTDAAANTGTWISAWGQFNVPAGFKGVISGYQASGSAITVLVTEMSLV